MVKRILLDASGLTISLPGFDVDSATDAQLALSADWTVANVIAVGVQDMQQTSGTILTLYDGSSLGYVPFVEAWLSFAAAGNKWQIVPTILRCFIYWESGLLKANWQLTQSDPVQMQYFVYARPKP